jgi:hypothetical protein
VAIYHLAAQPISRAAGRSAVAAAAYRSGSNLTDERTGVVHDYTRKGGVLHAELILPVGGTSDRSEFWNRLEVHHKRGDAVLAREVEVSLPTELTPEQRRELAVSFARELADRYQVAADVALHAPRTITDRDLQRDPGQYHETDPTTGRRHNGNWHAHILLSACRVQPNGTLGKKCVELDPIHCKRAGIENMADRERARWQELANAALAAAGSAARIDHRTLAAQGIERQPQAHLGPQAHAYERRTDQPSAKRVRQEQKAAERAAERAIERAIEREIAAAAAELQTALSERARLAAAQKVQLAEAAARRQAEAIARQAVEPAPDAQQQYAHQVEEHARRVEYARRVEAWREQTLAQLLRLEWARQEAPTAARQQRARQDLPTADAEHLRAQQHLLEARKRLRAQRWWNFMSLWRALRAQQQMPELEHRVRSWARAVEQLETLIHAAPRERVEASISEIQAQLLANPVPEVPPPPPPPPLPPAPTQALRPAPHQAPSDAPEPPRPRPRLQ